MRRTILLSLPLLALASSPALAQEGGNIDLQAFRPAMDSRGYITVNASQVLGPNELSSGGAAGSRVDEGWSRRGAV